MDEERVQVIMEQTELKSSDDLRVIWAENDSTKWTVEAVEAARRVLLARGEHLPEQRPREESMGYSSGYSAQASREGWVALGPAGTMYHVDDLQKIADYRAVRLRLSSAAIGSILFGIFALFWGFSSMGGGPLNVILVLLGFFLLAEGIWVLAAPSPVAMVVDGIALICLGVWNILITLLSLAGGARFPLFAVVGALQIMWGIQSFKRYGRYSHVSMQKPAEESYKMVDALAKAASVADSRRYENAVDFVADSAAWRGILSEGVAVFVCTRDRETLVTDPAQLLITAQGDGTAPAKALCQIRGRTLNCKISPVCLERMTRWKAAYMDGWR